MTWGFGETGDVFKKAAVRALTTIGRMKDGLATSVEVEPASA